MSIKRAVRAVGCGMLFVLSGSAMVAAQVPTAAQERTLAKFDPPYRLPDGVVVEADLVYTTVEDRPLHLDVFAPAEGKGPFPGVLFIQGSGYNGNNKVHFWREAAHLAKAGFVTVCIEHRGLVPDDAAWPAQLEDSRAALAWMRSNAARYGLDPDRVGAVGASSGGHLVAMLGTASSTDEASAPLRAIVVISGLLDPSYFGEHEVWSEEYGMRIDLAPLFGGELDEIPAVWADASPLNHVRGDEPPFLIIHGTADGSLPLEQAKRMHARLRDAGVETEFIPIEGGGHEMTNAYAYQTILRQLGDFLARHLKAESS